MPLWGQILPSIDDITYVSIRHMISTTWAWNLKKSTTEAQMKFTGAYKKKSVYSFPRKSWPYIWTHRISVFCFLCNGTYDSDKLINLASSNTRWWDVMIYTVILQNDVKAILVPYWLFHARVVSGSTDIYFDVDL